MAKIVRKVQKIFGSTAGVNQIGQFGSLAAGSIAYTTDPATIQALSNYLTGWFGAILGSNSPAIEDMNALCYLFAYQLSYLMQEGVAEWDATTTYYIGSVVNDGNGILYVSKTNTNLNNALTLGAFWKTLSGYSVDASPLDITVPVGQTYFQPNPTIPLGTTWTAPAGASITVTAPLIVTGTIVVGGTLRVI